MKAYYDPERNTYVSGQHTWKENQVQHFDWKAKKQADSLIRKLGNDGVVLDDGSDSYIIARKSDSY